MGLVQIMMAHVGKQLQISLHLIAIMFVYSRYLLIVNFLKILALFLCDILDNLSFQLFAEAQCLHQLTLFSKFRMRK